MEKEFMQRDVPEGLDRATADQLLKEKETLLTRIYTQLS